MTQQVVVTTDTTVELKPLVQSALRSEARLIELALERTRQRLRDFEARFGLTTEEFIRRFLRAEIEESLDYIEWAGEAKTVEQLEAQYQALLI